MERLEQYRNHINEIDEKLVAILEERMEVAKKIGDIKRAENLPIQDIKREKEVLENICLKMVNTNNEKGLKKIFETIMNVSKSIQY